MTLVEAVYSLFGVRRARAERPSITALREREQLAEAAAEAALSELRAVRVEYDPRCRSDRNRRLDSINSRIEQHRARLAELKETFANGST